MRLPARDAIIPPDKRRDYLLSPAHQQTRVFAVAGICGIPSTAKAIPINLTVTQPSAAGYVRVFTAGQPPPTTSSINYVAGQTRANNAITSLNANAELTAFVGQPAGTTVHLIIDANGYSSRRFSSVHPSPHASLNGLRSFCSPLPGREGS